MRHLPLLMCTAFCGLYSTQTKAADTKNEKPNILWLTFEDTSAYEFGCYGNRGVHTPNADSLAARGIQFMNTWSVAPQSSAARSSLITGCYSSTYGMDIHPVPYDTLLHLLSTEITRSRILLYKQQQDTLQLHHGQQKLLGRMYERSLLQQPEAR